MSSTGSEYSATPPQFPGPTRPDERNNPPVDQATAAPSLYELYDDARECCPQQPTEDMDSSQHVVDYSGILRNMSFASTTSTISSLSSVRSSSVDDGRQATEQIKQLEAKVDDMKTKFEKELSEKSAELKEKDTRIAHIEKELDLAQREAALEKREKEWFRQQSDEKQKKIDELQKEKEQLCKDVEDLRHEVKRLEEEMGAKVGRLAQDMDNVRNQNNGIQSSVDQMQRKMEQVTIQIPSNGKLSSLKSVDSVANQIAETFSGTVHNPIAAPVVSDPKMMDKILGNSNDSSPITVQDCDSVAEANNEIPEQN